MCMCLCVCVFVRDTLKPSTYTQRKLFLYVCLSYNCIQLLYVKKASHKRYAVSVNHH